MLGESRPRMIFADHDVFPTNYLRQSGRGYVEATPSWEILPVREEAWTGLTRWPAPHRRILIFWTMMMMTTMMMMIKPTWWYKSTVLILSSVRVMKVRSHLVLCSCRTRFSNQRELPQSLG